MKLHRMEITAFGPFPAHETIDFDLLNEAGVFLLNGETGSGKTSVLDAICFALYGTGPTTAAKGGRKAQRSDHAEPETAPRVDLEFTAGGRRWHVSRTPAWRAPSRRAASGWVERHATVLLRELVAGEWVDRGYRPDDVGQMIHHAVGLDREQFTQVMMLPQGQFARFLQAGSREREELLETLFGTDVYAGIQEELKARAEAAREYLRAAEADVERTDELLERFRDRVRRSLAQLPEDLSAELHGELAASSAPARDEKNRDEDQEVAGQNGEQPGQATADGPSDGGQTGTGDQSTPLSRAVGTGTRAAHGRSGVLTDTHEQEATPSRNRGDARCAWQDVVSGCADLVARVDRARAEASAAHARAAERHVRRTRLHAVLQRWEEATERLRALDEESERVAETARRLRGDAAARQLQDPLARAEHAERRAESLHSSARELRAGLGPGTATGRVARQVLAGDAELLDAVEEDSALPAGLRDAVVAARESARSAVERERSVDRDRAAAQHERARARELASDLERTRDTLRAAREELDLAQLHREQLALATKDEALVRDRARSTREAVTASGEYQRACADEAASGAAYERAEQERRVASAVVEELEARRFANAAATLAAELTPGEPCPVCGSAQHPSPAGTRDGEEVTTVDLDRARSDRDEAQEAADTAHQALERARRTTAETLARGADPDLDAVTARARAARDAEELLDNALEALQVGEQRLAAARERVTALEQEDTRTTVETGESRSRADALEQRCEQERAALELQLRGFATATEFLDRAEDLVRLVTELDAAQRALDTARQDASSSKDALERALAASPFESTGAVAAALMDQNRVARDTAWLQERERDLNRLEAELSTEDMQRAARLTPEERRDLSAESLACAAEDLTARELLRDQLSQQLGGLEALAAEARAAALDVPAHEEAYGRASERAARLTGLASVATATSSENSLRMTLTSFVLAAKLEHVASVASDHLSRMSSGRFTLVHTDETRGGGKSGLGLAIDDSWTGVRRGTETLSGGESFFTSLALALALADVVRAEAGGQDIDTLFVDEGFGSLDEQTLEQVLETLDGLRRDGRVIGVVSHVSEMKQRIATQLVVTKTPRGSHLDITVGP